MARDIVARVPGLAVWVVDRRENALEDTSVFERGDAQAAFDYYLGFQYKAVRDAPWAGRWGLKVALGDLRRVILAARAGGRREVILGGHSLGASTTAAYAAWDFGGRPGYRDIEGMVLIDGGLRGSFDSAGLARTREILAEIRAGQVFDDLLGLGLPEINGIFTEVAAQLAYEKPDEPSVLQGYALLPDIFKPPVPVTNEAAAGLRVRRDHLAGGLRADPHPRRGARRERRSARLGRRRAHADPPLRPRLGGRAAERHAVVLLQAPAPRRGRDEPDAPHRRHAPARAAALPHERDRRAALCLRHRPHRRPGGARRALAGPELRRALDADRPRPRGQPPRSRSPPRRGATASSRPWCRSCAGSGATG